MSSAHGEGWAGSEICVLLRSLAPEHPYPTPLDNAKTVLNYVTYDKIRMIQGVMERKLGHMRRLQVTPSLRASRFD